MIETLINNPLVSVIMPVYNCLLYIDEAIESMVNQSYTNMEIFIVDDCSTDGTKGKVEYWASLDERIKPIYKVKNSGYVESLNIAIGMSNGVYIARMDGDDISLPDRIKKQVDFLNLNIEIGVVGSGCSYVDGKKFIVPQLDHDKIKIGFLFNNQVSHPSVLFRSEVFKYSNLKYLAEFVPAEDYMLWTQLIKITKFANIQDNLISYRVHGNNISINKRDEELNIEIIYQQLKGLHPDLNRSYAKSFFALSKRQYTPNSAVEGFEFLLLTLKLINLNNAKKIYNKKHFVKFITLNAYIIIQCIGWKFTFLSIRLGNVNFLGKVLAVPIYKLVYPNYDFCLCDWEKSLAK